MAERWQNPAASPLASRWDLKDMVWLADHRTLSRRWRATSLATGWTRPDDWWAPEVESVARAVLADVRRADSVRDSVAAAARLGRARAQAGVGMPEALDDLYALYQLLPGGRPHADVLRSLAEAWAEVALRSCLAITCEDPLSGLASAAYLRTRLAEVYREAERAGRTASETHTLLVVRCDPGPAERADAQPDGDGSQARWDWMLHRLTLGDALRAVFSGGETFAALSRGVTLGLVARDEALPRMLRGLTHQLRQVVAAEPVRVWVEGLPPGLPDAYELLVDLRR